MTQESPTAVRRGLQYVLAAALLALSGTSLPSSRWESNFQSGLADWGLSVRPWGRENQTFRDEPGISGKILRVAVHKGGIDPATMRARGQPISGTGFKANIIPGGTERAVLRYKVRFPLGFQFVRGGKLPGLYGGAGNSGGKIPDGSDGFSFRLMWLQGGLGRVYAYLPSSINYGNFLLEGRLRFWPGRWHHITEELTLNRVGASDGVVRILIDGQLIGEQRGLRIRTTPSLKIDGVFFDFFFGGNDDTWAAREDTYVDFAEFEVTWQ